VTIRTHLVQAALALIALLSCDVRAFQGDVNDRVLTSRSFPVGTITMGPSLVYVGSEEFVLYDLATCEIHLWVDAPNKHVQRMYWVQFESYLANNSYTYSYSELPSRLKLGPHVFHNGVRFFNLDDDRKKWRPGSDYERVLGLLESHGYSVGSELMELALFLVDRTARRELMVIYMEDLAPLGISAAELSGSKDGRHRAERVAADLRKRALSGVILDVK
jgi:hypothetical protein